MKTASAPPISGVTALFNPAQKLLAVCASRLAAGDEPMTAAHSAIAMAGFIAAGFIAIRVCEFWVTSLRRPLTPAAAANGKRPADGPSRLGGYPHPATDSARCRYCRRRHKSTPQRYGRVGAR